jgi:hypothetical protein
MEVRSNLTPINSQKLLIEPSGPRYKKQTSNSHPDFESHTWGVRTLPSKTKSHPEV